MEASSNLALEKLRCLLHHSSLSGTLGLICLWLQPALLDDIIGGYSEFAYITVCVTFGYFWYDTVDLILNSDKEKSNRELVVHHAFALTSASILVYTKTFVGFGVVSLMIELHSVTLHARVLLKLYTRSQITLAYQIVKWSNIFTFFVFRFATIFYLFYALHRDRYSAFNYVIYTFLCLATTVIFLLSCQLFMRVLQADFLPKKVEKKTTEELLEVTTPQCLVSGPEKTPM
ncbi:TLC domain-containing protein 1 [Halotydeus destructor]|nr:TLC domain-containing protein 1 [Halotydeus destructor]